MKHYLKIYVLLIAMCLCDTSQLAGSDIAKEGSVKHDMRYVTFLTKDKLDSVLKYADTDIVPIIFKVNKYDLIPNAQLDSITYLIDKLISDKRVQLGYVWIGGSASPEGPESLNMALGYYRSTVLARYIKSHTHIPKEKLRVVNLGEDWYSVSRKLDRIDFPRKDEIQQIIRDEPDWRVRKERIKAIDNGYTWKKLIREVFAPFRNGRMVIVCIDEECPIGPKIEMRIPQIMIDLPLPPQYLVQAREPKARANRFYAVKTNLAFLAVMGANIGIEGELWRNWSIDIPVWYSPYDIRRPDRKIRLLATQPELRYWISKAGEGVFVGFHSHLAGFNIAINDRGRYQDPNRALWGFGLGLGYSVNIGKSKRWAVEFNAGAGYADYVYDSYRNWRNGYKYESGIHEHYWGITRVGINIGYKWYRQRKRGK